MATAAPGAPPLPLESASRLRPVHTRTQVLGLLACGLAASVALGAEGLGALPFLAPFIAIPLVGAGLAWRFGVWAKVVGVVLGGLLLFQVAPAVGEVITHPNSFFDFVPILTFTLGALLAVGGGVAAIVRRADQRLVATALERAIRWGVIAAIGLMIVGSGVATVAGKTAVDAGARAGALDAIIHEFDFQLPVSTIAAGEPTRMVVANDDRVLHTFTVEGTDVDVTITPGSEALVELPALEAGTHTVYCRPHSEQNSAGEWEGMVSTLVVR
jgi:plastocyanin